MSHPLMTQFSVFLHVLIHLDCVLNSELSHINEISIALDFLLAFHYTILLQLKFFSLENSFPRNSLKGWVTFISPSPHINVPVQGTCPPFSFPPSSLKLPGFRSPSLEILFCDGPASLSFATICSHAIPEKEKSSPYEVSARSLSGSKSNVWCSVIKHEQSPSPLTSEEVI